MKLRTSALVVLAVIFSASFAFAGIKKSECGSVDWQKKGHEDGLKGEKINQLYKYTKTCDSADAPFSADEYRIGRNEGLEVYCSNRSAYNHGLKNKSKSKKGNLSDFVEYFEKGRSFVKLSKKQKKVSRKVDKYKKYIDKLEKAETELNSLNTEVENAEFKVDMEETNVNRSAAFMKLKPKEKFIIENDIVNSPNQTEVGTLQLGEEAPIIEEPEEEVEEGSQEKSYDLETLEINYDEEAAEALENKIM